MRPVYQDARLWIGCGQAADYPFTDVDFILTNPYGPIPKQLAGLPMLVHQWVHRLEELKVWTHQSQLELVSVWNLGREAVWVANAPVLPVDLSDLSPTEEGWWPEELPRRLLAAYGSPVLNKAGQRPRVWDGFMGRGTGGKAALEAGLRYTGVDNRPEMMAVALAYLGVETTGET
jgi:hypothetical protein